MAKEFYDFIFDLKKADKPVVLDFSHSDNAQLKSHVVLDVLSDATARGFKPKKREEKVLEDVKQFCLDTCLLSGHSPNCIDASLFYLKYFDSNSNITQSLVAEDFGISCVSLRNNVKKIRQSEHWNIIKIMLSASDRKV